MNSELVRQFEQIAQIYKSNNETYRSKTYQRAAKALETYPEEVSSGAEVAELVRGIGKAIAADIDGYLKTGTVPRLKDLLTTVDPEREEILDSFKKIFGVGPKTAEKFYQAGYRTVEDVGLYAPLTDAQRLGVMYYYHLLERIPRSEIDQFKCLFEDTFPRSARWEIVGSYRRGTPDSGDIDVIIQQSPDVSLTSIVHDLEPYLKGTLSLGSSKFLGLISLGPEYPVRRLDLLIVPKESYPFALLYFTGSQQLNIQMRTKANSLGLKLSEFKLADIDDELVSYPANTEQEIFDMLGVEYLNPSERSL